MAKNVQITEDAKGLFSVKMRFGEQDKEVKGVDLDTAIKSASLWFKAVGE